MLWEVGHHQFRRFWVSFWLAFGVTFWNFQQKVVICGSQNKRTNKTSKIEERGVPGTAGYWLWTPKREARMLPAGGGWSPSHPRLLRLLSWLSFLKSLYAKFMGSVTLQCLKHGGGYMSNPWGTPWHTRLSYVGTAPKCVYMVPGYVFVCILICPRRPF